MVRYEINETHIEAVLYERDVAVGRYILDIENGELSLHEGKEFLIGSENIQKEIIITDNIKKAGDSKHCVIVNIEGGYYENCITSAYESLVKCEKVFVDVKNDSMSLQICKRLLTNSFYKFKDDWVKYTPKEIVLVDDVDFNKDVERIDLKNKQLNVFCGGVPVDGSVTMLSGSSGSGKTSFLTFLFATLIKLGVPVWQYSVEMSNQHTYMAMGRCLNGGENVDKVLNPLVNLEIGKIKNSAIAPTKDFLRGKMFLLDSSTNHEHGVLHYIKDAYLRFGVRVFSIDNLFSLDLSSYGNDTHECQTNFIMSLKILMKEIGGHCYLVAHPRKNSANQQANSSIDDFSKDDISGSLNLVNAIDNLIILARAKDKDLEYYQSMPEHAGKEANVVVKVLKSREFGHEGTREYFVYSHTCTRFLTPNTRKSEVAKQFIESYIPNSYYEQYK